MEKKNNVKLKVKGAKEVHTKIVNLLSSKKEGYVEYHWVKTDNLNDKLSKKIAYVAYFEPFDWYIGTGEYIEDIDKSLQTSMLKILSSIDFSKKGYIGVADVDGTMLLSFSKKLIGKNLINIRDKDGRYIAKEYIQLAKKGGGYLEHRTLLGNQNGKTIAYVKALDSTKLVYSTFRLNDIEKEISQKKNKLEKDYFYITFFMFFIFFVILFYIYYLSKKFRDRIEKSFNRFENYFLKAADENISIQTQDMEFKEFENLAIHTNRLVEKIKDLNKNLEQKVEFRTQELEKTNIELNDTINKLESTEVKMIEVKKMASLGELVAGVSHEINTPVGLSLTGITHFSYISKNLEKLYRSENLSKDELEEFIKTSNELADSITISLKQAAEVIKSFKTVAIDQTSQKSRTFKLKGYFDEVILSLRNKTKKLDLNISIDCDELLEIDSYPGAISQILTNLVMNSIIHGFEDSKKGSIRIVAKSEDNNLYIEYSDDGKGIPKNNLSRIFEPFYTTKKEDGGSGLGLNIIKKIIEDDLKGTISCKSTQGKGATFYIEFPIQ